MIDIVYLMSSGRCMDKSRKYAEITKGITKTRKWKKKQTTISWQKIVDSSPKKDCGARKYV